MRSCAFALLFLVVMPCSLISAAEGTNKEAKEEKNKLDGIKCLFCEMQVKEDVFAEYKGAKVYLGCEGCVGAFKENVKKVAAKANAQLVATKQAKQQKCPISGQPFKSEFKLAIGKAQVAFCCEKCKKAAAELKDQAQLEKLFGEEVFKKAFEVVKPEKKQAAKEDA